jgi:hypothetical protein
LGLTSDRERNGGNPLPGRGYSYQGVFQFKRRLASGNLSVSSEICNEQDQVKNERADTHPQQKKATKRNKQNEIIVRKGMSSVDISFIK